MSHDLSAAYCRDREPRACWIAKTLHERMMVEAEPTIRRNWVDVAVHDAKKLESVPRFHWLLWIVHENGSCLAPLYCELYPSVTKDGIPPAIHYLLRLQYNCTMLGVDRVIAGHRFYFVRRGAGQGGEIIETDVNSLIKLVSGEKMHWSPVAGFCYS